MTVRITGEQVKKAVMAANIKTVNHHECSICGCMVRYVVDDGDLFFDPSCFCSSWMTGYEPRTWDDAANWINMQSDEKWRVEIARRFGIDFGGDEMSDKLPKFEGMTEDDEAVLRGAIVRMNASDVEQFNEYEQRIADLEARLAEAQRREGLLRAALDAAHDFIETVAYLDFDPRTARYSEKLQAAIDGGALEGGE